MTTATPCRSKCGPCDPAIALANVRGPRTARPHFFLHESGGFNFSTVFHEMRSLLAGRPPDAVLPVSEAQYLLDMPLIEAFTVHPQRTLDPAHATIHVLAVAPWASQIMGRHSGGSNMHEARMQGVADELRRNPFFRRGSLFVVLVGGETLGVLGTALQRELASGLGQVYISRNLLRHLMLWLGKRNFPKYPVPEGWVKDISRNITCQRA